MLARSINATALPRCSWSRIASVSGAVTVHVFALMLLAQPGDLPMQRTEAVEVRIQWIEPAPEPIAVPLPPEPLPQRVAQRPTAAKPPIVIAPVKVSDSTITEPVSAIDELPTAQPLSSIAGSAPARSGANVTLDYVHIVNPRFPRDSQRRGEQGTVLLRVLVGIDGVPQQIEVARSSGSPRIDRAAREAVQQWRFRPVQVDGVAVPASGLVPIEFNLDRA